MWLNAKKKNEDIVKAYFFDSATDKLNWLEKIKEDVSSPTGFIYGNVQINQNTREGFYLPDKVWIIKNDINTYWINDQEFKRRFEII